MGGIQSAYPAQGVQGQTAFPDQLRAGLHPLQWAASTAGQKPATAIGQGGMGADGGCGMGWGIKFLAHNGLQQTGLATNDACAYALARQGPPHQNDASVMAGNAASVMAQALHGQGQDVIHHAGRITGAGRFCQDWKNGKKPLDNFALMGQICLSLFGG